MKPNLIKIFAFCCSITTITCSCSKIDDFGTINQNPNTTTTPVPSGLLTNVLSQMGADVWDAWSTNSAGLTTTCGLYCQYYASSQYPEQSNYARPNLDWDSYYSGRLYDLQVIINYNTDPATAGDAAAYGSNNNQVAVARILKVYLFSLLTDCYGDLPYFNALTANNGINPFDSQEDIYRHFFTELEAAVQQFDDGNAPLGDILFNGNMVMWKKFANSLRALLALNISKADPETGKAAFNTALTAAEGVFENGENALLRYPGISYYNLVYNYYVVAKQNRLGVASTMTDWLAARNDPRISKYGNSGLGIPYGLTHDSVIIWANANTGWARILQGDKTAGNTPTPIITAAQVYLARAEAARKGWTNEDATALYEEGIKNNFQYWGVYAEADFSNYMQQPTVALTGGNDDLQRIYEQQWAAHYPNGPRGYTTWRRTGYPVLLPGPGATHPDIPRRFPYGSKTYGSNPDNTNTAAARYAVNGENDSMWGRVWWDAP